MVARKSLHAVRLNTEKIGHKKHVGDYSAFIRRKAEMAETVLTEGLQLFIGILDILAHFFKHLSL